MIATYIVQVKFPNGTATKIGSTANWDQRRKSLARELPGLTDLLIIECANYSTALRKERLLQDAFEDFNLNTHVRWKSRRGDWFNIPFQIKSKEA